MIDSAIKQIISIASIRVLSVILNFMFTFLIARNMSVGEAGNFFLFHTIVNVLAVFLLCGTHHSTLKHVAFLYGRNESEKILSVVCFSTVVVISLTVITYLISRFLIFSLGIEFSELIKEYYPMIFLGSSLLSLTLLFSHQIQALDKAVLSTCISYLVPVSIIVFFILVSSIISLKITISVFVASYFFCSLVGIAYILLCNFGFSMNFLLCKDVLKDCWSLWLSSLLNVLSVWSHVLVGSYFLSSEDFAVFSVAYRITLGMTLILFAAETYLAPLFSRYREEQNKNRLKILVFSVTRALTVVSITLGLVIIFLANQIMGLFGEQYLIGTNILLILSFGQVVNISLGPLTTLMMMSNYGHRVPKLLLVILVISVCIVLMLTQMFGMIGCALGVTMSLIIKKLILVFYINKFTKINILTCFAV